MSSDDEDYGSDFDDSLLLAASNQLERQSELPAIIEAQATPPKSGDNEDYFDGLFTSDLIEVEEETAPIATDPGPLRQRNLFGHVVGEDDAVTTTVRSWRLVNHQEPPTHHKIDREAAKTWIYPTNVGHREYQFNIVKRALFSNVLVALPTGLGKTFIAATVMLNWYRWAPESQIIFMAPTKPLVTQQVDACFKIAGIPRSQTCQLTGNVSPALRAEFWQERRVFFMTPQTLETDLTSGRCDPKRISLMVIDEAHRATGAYAYTKVIKFIRRFNNSFRVMALTATPGSKIETVQEVISSLGIARTEIRTEESLDIRDYINKRNVVVQTFPLSEEISMLKDLFAEVLLPPLKKLNEVRAFYITDPTMLTTFGLHDARVKWMLSDAGRKSNGALKGMVLNYFSLLATLAYAFELLLYHGIRPFYEYLNEFYNENSQKPNGGGKLMSSIIGDKNFIKILRRCRTFFDAPDFVGHPKLDFLCSTILRHFSDATERGEEDTRVMVFSNYRKSGEEILRVLKTHQPIIKPQIFIGQSAGKTGEGMSQKEQQAVVEKFKDGGFNVLVATSIGEEGLDIGEVDFIICYDASASPIRMLQRMGRTGRKRTGGVLVLVTEGKEFRKWEKANDNYRWIQEKISSGKDFQYAEDLSPRIIPADIDSQPDKQFITPPEENSQPEPQKKNSRVRKKAPPRKFHMPDGVETGFTTAAKLGAFTRVSSVASAPPRSTATDDSDSDFPQETVNEETFHGSIDPEAGLLTADEEAMLHRRYMYTLEEDSIIHHPRLDAFVSHQRSLTATDIVGHGRRTKSVVRMLKRINTLDDTDIQGFKTNLVHEDTQFGKAAPAKTPRIISAKTTKPDSSLGKPAASSISKLAAFKAPSRTASNAKVGLSERSSKTISNHANITRPGFAAARVLTEKPTNVPKRTKENIPAPRPITPEIDNEFSMETSPEPSQTLVVSSKMPSARSRQGKNDSPQNPSVDADIMKEFSMDTSSEGSQSVTPSSPAVIASKTSSRLRSVSESSDDLPSAAQLTQQPLSPPSRPNKLAKQPIVNKRLPENQPLAARKKQRTVVVDSDDDDDDDE